MTQIQAFQPAIIAISQIDQEMNSTPTRNLRSPTTEGASHGIEMNQKDSS